MPYIAPETTFDNTPNFLKSTDLKAFTVTATQDQGGEDKVVKAGTIWPSNDASAEGIIFNDVNVQYNDQPASLIVEGYILEDRLPEKPSEEAKQALKEIKFY